MKQEKEEQGKDVRKHQSEWADSWIKEKPSEWPQERRVRGVDKLLETTGIPRSKKVQDNFQSNQAVDEVKNIVDDLAHHANRFVSFKLVFRLADFFDRLLFQDSSFVLQTHSLIGANLIGCLIDFLVNTLTEMFFDFLVLLNPVGFVNRDLIFGFHTHLTQSKDKIQAGNYYHRKAAGLVEMD